MSVTSVLEQYQIADFIEWWSKKRLVLNPDFQRRSVWTAPAKSYLIETILKQLPMPKFYLRTTIDVVSQSSVREVVDGQQRLRAILDFAQGTLRLTKRASEFNGLRYTNLDQELKERFLGYRVSVEQLINATDDDVLEVFARLNSYTVPLSPPELRHAEYQGDFKWKVRELSTHLSPFWTNHGVFSTRERVRMLDDSLTAEMLGIILEGVRDGGQSKIKKLYDRHDKNFPEAAEASEKLRMVTGYIDAQFSEQLKAGLFAGPPHLLMLFAAVAHSLFGIPRGEIPEGELPESHAPIDVDVATANLDELTNAVLTGTADQDLLSFVNASKSSTQRIASRKTRFPFLYRALQLPV